MTRTEFIDFMASLIKKHASDYGICVISPIIAQACKESAFGTSELSVKANNVFGIKYKKGRTQIAIGGYNKATKEEYTVGQITDVVSCFAKFSSLEDCVVGYFQFISVSRYSNLKGVTDPEQYCRLIKSDGYATGSAYDTSLIDYIKKYDLTKYDENEERPMLINIDAGHGSNTAGKRTPDGYREHYFNVDVAVKLNEALIRCGINTHKTGWNDANSKDDKDTSLTERQKQIKSDKCDYSISIHYNASGDGRSYNSAQGVDVFVSDKPTGYVESKKLADCIHAELIKGTKQKDRGVKRKALSMCNNSLMGTKASCLCELGFMTNKYEADLMQNQAFIEECAEEICRGFCAYANITYIYPNKAVNEPVNEPQAVYHTVAKGESLSKIAKKYGVKWHDVAKLNGIKIPYIIRVGQKIKIK